MYSYRHTRLTVCGASTNGLSAAPERDKDADVADDEDDEREDGGHDEVGPHLVVVRVQLAVGPVPPGNHQQGLVRSLVLNNVKQIRDKVFFLLAKENLLCIVRCSIQKLSVCSCRWRIR